jgi:hypothetical protein
MIVRGRAIPALFLALGPMLASSRAASQTVGRDQAAQRLPTVRIVFFTPAGVEVPAEVQPRMERIAEAAESFLTSWMKKWNYPPGRDRIFERRRDGSVQVLYVKGNDNLASGRYQKPVFAAEVITKASRRYRIPGDRNLWWIFAYFGPPPLRIDEYRGHGTAYDGGWAIVNYLSTPGEIRPKGSLAKGFNSKFTLKACIHELGHAFGLPHLGPNPAAGLGNNLMGPNNEVYAARGLPDADKVYLSEAEAALLWKHPIFSRVAAQRTVRPQIALFECKARTDSKKRQVTLSGKLIASPPAHTAIVLDDLGNSKDEYWLRGYTGRIASDGTFRVKIDRPSAPAGEYRIVFAFNNGAIAGDGTKPDYYNAAVKAYRLSGGRYVFSD